MIHSSNSKKVKYGFKLYIQNGLGADIIRIAKFKYLCDKNNIDFYMEQNDNWEIVPLNESTNFNNWCTVFNSLKLTDEDIPNINVETIEEVGVFDNFEEFASIIKEIFVPNDFYNDELGMEIFKSRYAVIHIRRGDKVETSWKEGMKHELDEYYDKIKHEFSQENVFVMTDSEDVAQEALQKGFVTDLKETRRDGYVYKNYTNPYNNEEKTDEIKTCIKNFNIFKHAECLVGSNSSWFYVLGQLLNGKIGISLSDNLYYKV